MLRCEIDHLVVTAASLEAGAEYVRKTLGVTPQVGGEHVRMGTHNLLVKLGETIYLEVIAINPAAPRLNRARWFELDARATNAPPRLTTWVARVNHIDAAMDVSPIRLGKIEPMSRGQLFWLIAVPIDGSLPMQGIAPTLIQWADGRHPASRLDDLGCSLIRLEGFHHEADKIAAMLKAVGFAGEFGIAPLMTDERPFLVATINTPGGVRQLSGREDGESI